MFCLLGRIYLNQTMDCGSGADSARGSIAGINDRHCLSETLALF